MSSAGKRRPTPSKATTGARPSAGSGRTVKPPAPAKPISKGAGKGPAGSARARLAAQQAEAEQRRRRLILVIVPLAVILVAAATLVVVRFATRNSTAVPTTGGTGVIPKVTNVPPTALNQVGAGTATSPPKRIDGAALTSGGKPKVLYVGAEYCPYCAAERWPVVVALSRFGSFSNLGQTSSSGSDAYPNTPTLSFHGASFSSDTVVFTGVETEDRNGQPLDTLSADDQKTFETFDYPPYVSGKGGSIPFVDIGGRYLISGASYDAQVLQGKTHQQIADALSDPNSDIAKAVDGTANMITAAICASTDDKPASVCTSAGVQAAAKALG